MMVTQASRTGRAAAAAGVLMAAGVEGEWLLNPQRDDGTVTDKPEFALLLVVSTVGFVLLSIAVRGLRRESARRTRPARVGATMSLIGAGMLAVFGALVLGTGVASGSPLEASFLAFALGLLLLSIGQVVWGLSLRRQSPAPGVWQVLLVAGVMAFASIAIPLDPWHDVSLIAMFLAWSVIGVLLLRNRTVGNMAPEARRASKV
jgi:hypothetical protein